MSLFSKDIRTLDDLFVHTLRDVYYAEKRILKALPEMIEKATNVELRDALGEHLDESREHVTRLERVFSLHGAEAKTVNCPAIDGIIKEAEELSADIDDKSVLDAAIIAAAQAVEHYEITRYGTLVAWATQLGRPDCAAILEETLEEEKGADETLTDLAEGSINAMAEDGEAQRLPL